MVDAEERESRDIPNLYDNRSASDYSIALDHQDPHRFLLQGIDDTIRLGMIHIYAHGCPVVQLRAFIFA